MPNGCKQMYRTDADPGLACGGRMAVAALEARTVAPAGRRRSGPRTRRSGSERLERIQQELAKGEEQAQPQWYVNGQGQTMVVIPGPVEFVMGRRPRKRARDR